MSHNLDFNFPSPHFLTNTKENQYPSGLAKSGNTYVHKKLWKEVKPKGCRQPYNYYPRGRIEINAKGNPIIFMNPHIETHFIPQIMFQFGLKELPQIIYDSSEHYKCYLDYGWRADW